MTEEEINILTSESVRSTIRENLDKDPASFALAQKDNSFPVHLVSTHLKYLQKAKYKLPSYYNQQCLIPPLAYEQSSSEATASMKPYVGKRCLDLTMGLGVDSWQLSKNFDHVIALDTNEGLIRVAKKNFQLLGRTNIQLVHQPAELFLQDYSGPRFDLIYVDPARRDQSGRRIHDLGACFPNVFELMPLMLKNASCIVIKASPLYDINEARKKIPSLRQLSVHSVQNEVKELILEVEQPSVSSKVPHLEVVISRKDKVSRYEFDWEESTVGSISGVEFPHYLYEPDVAFYKIRSLAALFSKYFDPLPGYITHKMGFFASKQLGKKDFPGRIFQVKEQFLYKPKELRRYLNKEGIKRANVVVRNFPFDVKKIRKDLKLNEGGDFFLVGTQLGGKNVMFATERIH